MADKYEVKVTKQALGQMQEITDYIAHELCAPLAANNLLDEMEKIIQSLGEMPKRMPLVSEEPWRNEGVRKTVVKNFLVYFWVDDENLKVQITAVIYGKRDQLKHMKKMSW